MQCSIEIHRIRNITSAVFSCCCQEDRIFFCFVLEYEFLWGFWLSFLGFFEGGQILFQLLVVFFFFLNKSKFVLDKHGVN